MDTISYIFFTPGRGDLLQPRLVRSFLPPFTNQWIASARAALLFLAAVTLAAHACPQEPPAGREAHLGSMLDDGMQTYHAGELTLRLVRSTGTVAGQTSKTERDFDFTPSELLAARSVDGYYHLGDIDLQLRTTADQGWTGYSTALKRTPLKPLPPQSGELARYDLTPALPSTFPLRLTRLWLVDHDELVLRFVLRNNSSKPVEIGSLGIPLIFDNILTGKTLDQAHSLCTFADPSIAMDAGYVQVTRLSGHGPALLVVPDGKTPFEAYGPIPGPDRRESAPELFHDQTPRSLTFEGFYEWMVASRAYADKSWKGVQEWNPPTSITLAPGEERSYGVRFLLAPQIRSIESTLAAHGRPVAVGFPGYVLPQDQDGRLFLNYPAKVAHIEVEPAGAITLTETAAATPQWKAYSLQGKQWGRARVSITYADGLTQVIQYLVTKPLPQIYRDLGKFSFSKQWFVDPADPFRRSPSVMTYDREAGKLVTQDSRVWIAGLGDEAGSGSWLAAAMKEFAQPDQAEIGKLEDFVDHVLWGGLQYKDGPQKFGVRKSLFYYQPDQMPAGTYDAKLDWHSWTSWNKAASEQVDRSYNYPHVVALYWAMYRIARNHPGLVSHHDWRWYLDQAFETSLAMPRFAPDLSQFGQMEGDIFVAVLQDLRREGEDENADRLEKVMRARAEVWRKLKYPFGSEMPWDSTGQEEVYAWTRYFGMDEKAQITLDAITGYMPTLPNWGYNGSARRYWDFLFGGKYPRIERQLHHYGSGLNAIPILDAYRRNPSDLYLLRIAYGGLMGAVTGIDQQGASSVAFHSYPDRMAFDPYSGDYGPNFFGHVWGAGSYLVHDATFGWIGFGGNVTEQHALVTIVPRDGMRQRVYIAPIGLWLHLDSGAFKAVHYNASSRTVIVDLDAADPFTPAALLHIEQPARVPGVGTYRPARQWREERGGFVIPLGRSPESVELAVAAD